MEIQRMTAAHTKRLAELEELCFSQPWSEKALREEIENPSAYFVTAVSGDTILGYGGMHSVLGESYVDNIAVFPDWRGQGIGRAITEALIQKAKENDGVFITLEVRVSNAPAIALYTALGFERIGLRKNFYTAPNEDAAIMTLSFIV